MMPVDGDSSAATHESAGSKPRASATEIDRRSLTPFAAACARIASSFGRDKHPAWYHNLSANPEATLERGGRRATYRAAEVHDDAERDRLFALADRVYGGYADYRERTGQIGRRIPVMRLELVPG